MITPTQVGDRAPCVSRRDHTASYRPDAVSLPRYLIKREQGSDGPPLQTQTISVTRTGLICM